MIRQFRVDVRPGLEQNLEAFIKILLGCNHQGSSSRSVENFEVRAKLGKSFNELDVISTHRIVKSRRFGCMFSACKRERHKGAAE